MRNNDSSLLVVVVLFCIIFLSACGKKYTCHCEVVSVPEGGSSEFTIQKWRRSKAMELCNSHSTMQPNTIPPSYDTYCTLK